MTLLHRAVISVVLVSAICLGMIACGQPSIVNTSPPTNSPASCLWQAGTTFGEAYLDKERVDAFQYYGIIKKCADVVNDLAHSFFKTKDLDAIVQFIDGLPDLKASIKTAYNSSAGRESLDSSPSGLSFTYTFDSTILDNCSSPNATSGTFSYNLPLVLMVGTNDAQGTFHGTTFVEPLPGIQPTGSDVELLPAKGNPFNAVTDEEIVAKQIYTQEDFPDNYFNKQGQYSDDFPLTLPAHSKVQLHLPLTVYYRMGEGEVNHKGQAGQGLLWDYVYTFDRAFDAANLTPQQMVVTPC